MARVTGVGATDIEAKDTGTIVTATVELLLEKVAETDRFPAAIAVSCPDVETVANELFVEAHVARLVTSLVVPSL
jgi:hypothetical protein